MFCVIMFIGIWCPRYNVNVIDPGTLGMLVGSLALTDAWW